MEGEIKNLIKVWLSILASLCYCYFLVSKIPKGKLRLCALLPIFFLFTILPFYLSNVLPTVVIALFFSWFGNFKLLLFAFDKGPLSSHHPSNSFTQFLFNACLPIKIKEKEKYTSPQTLQSPQNSSPKHPKLPLNWPTKVLLFAIFVGANDHKHGVHPKIVLLGYCFMVYLLIDIILGVSNGLVHATTGLELEPPSDQPYLSSSLQEFWGRRWNLMVSNLLRHTIYKPVKSTSEIFLGSKWAPFSSVIATFLVSGLMHELLFYYVIRGNPTWEVTWFFVLNGACVAVERGLKMMFSDRLQLHWVVSMPFTVGFVVATAMWLFFPPLLRTGMVDRAIEECKVLLDFAMLVLSNAKGLMTHFVPVV